MMGLLVLKERLKVFYAKYDMYFYPIIKFILAFTTFYVMNQNIGFMAKLKTPMIPFLLGLVCAFLPYGAISLLAAVFLLAHVYSVSLEIALIIMVFFMVIGILYYGFQPGDSYLLILTPLMFLFKIPYVIPLLVGLSGSLISIIPISCGVFIYYVFLYVKQNAGVLTNDASMDITQKYIQIIKSLVSNQLMVVMICACAVGVLVVYLIKNLSMDYAWIIAIIAGTVAQLAAIFVGDFMFDVFVPMGQLLMGVVVSVIIAGIYDFFVFAVDYSRTEYTQFEDDDYYYYVKAVPKIAVSAPDVKVQKINTRKNMKGGR